MIREVTLFVLLYFLFFLLVEGSFSFLFILVIQLVKTKILLFNVERPVIFYFFIYIFYIFAALEAKTSQTRTTHYRTTTGTYKIIPDMTSTSWRRLLKPMQTSRPIMNKNCKVVETYLKNYQICG